MMKSYLISWAVVAVVFLAVDAVWLSQMHARLYKPLLGDLMATKVDMGAAVAFYLLYVTGIVFFCVAPALGEGSFTTALLRGAALGLLAYGTYDLTNQATLRGWDWRLTLADMAWGMIATAVAAGAAYAVAAKFR